MAVRQKALSENSGNGAFAGAFGCFGYLFGFAFCTMFFGMGCFFLYMIAIRPMLSIQAASDWVETPCTITKSKVEGSDTYKIMVEYDYTFDGKDYEGKRYDFIEMSSSGRTSKERVVAKYPEGSQQVCYVDPDNPGDAVINRSLSSSLWWGLFPLPFIAIGLIGYIAMFFGAFNFGDKFKKIQQQALSQSGAASVEPIAVDMISSGRSVKQSEWGNSDYDEEDLYEEPGPVRIYPDASAFGTAIFLTFFALVWNGIISVFIFQRIDDWMKFQFEGFEDLFLIPFILVGVGVGIGAIYCFMAGFNPRPTIALSRQLIPLGGSAKAQWVFDSGTGSVRTLKFLLIGEEEAKYRRGTSTYTDHNTFHEELLLETTDPMEMNGGQIEISIPTDTMHTFHGGNNKINWSLHLKGDIPLWPDISMKFPIRVVPHE